MNIRDPKTILERITEFYEFELKLNSKELKYWDIFRREIFLKYCYRYDLNILKQKYHGLTKIKYLFFSFLSMLSMYRLKEKKIIYVSSRCKKDDCFYDPNIYDIYLTDKKGFRIIETSNFTNKLIYHSNNENFIKVLKKLIKREKIPEEVKQIANKIDLAMKNEIDFAFYIDLYHDFKRELKIYLWLYSLLKPKIIFFVNTDNHKGRILAAKRLGIPIIEIQHGDIGFQSCPYYYDLTFDKTALISPDGIMVQSDFWKKNIRYNGFIENIGTSYYYRNKKSTNCKYDLTIFTNAFNMEIFRTIINELIMKSYSGKICVKLHPDQYSDYADIKTLYKDFPNIEVIFREVDGIQLLEESKQVFLVHSTIAYQAVNMGVKTIILVEPNKEYQLYGELLKEKAVSLINNTNELFEQLNKQKIESFEMNSIYEPFHFDNYKKIEKKYLG